MADVVLDGGAVRLYRADWRDVADELDAEAVVTDPPYGIGYRRRGNSSRSISSTGKVWTEPVAGDDRPFDPGPWCERYAAVGLTGAGYFYDRLPAGGSLHVWDKRGPYRPTNQADVDLVWINRRRPSRKLEVVWRGLCRTVENDQRIEHPTQKPVALMRWIAVELLGCRGTVLDPFMGAGTTGVACAREGLPFVGVELKPDHFEVAARRIAEAVEARGLWGGA